MIDPKSIKEKLFGEKSLSDILKTFESAFPIPLTGKWLSGFCVIIAGILATAYYQIEPSHLAAQKMISGLVGFGIIMATALLGVVIAGFSIFASSLDSEIVMDLAESNYHDSGPNNLSFIFASFIYVLVALFGLLVTSLVFVVFLSVNSVVFQQVILVFFAPELQLIFVLTFLCLYLGQLVFVISVLFSFLWNLHQVLMVMAAAKILKLAARSNAPSEQNADDAISKNAGG